MTTLIIGGGWSGLAAAVRLVQQGHQVTLIEAAKQLGGRARNIDWQGKTVDNGQHLMIGAYHRMLDMLHVVGIDTNIAFKRTPIDITLYDTHYSPLKLSAKTRLPWPLSLAWNLLSSGGLSLFWQVSRLQRSIPSVLSAPDITVAQWLQNTEQSARLIKQLWEPLCLATLNTPIIEASAHVLATVLHESLGKAKANADLLIPNLPLGDVFPNQAAKYIVKHGGQIRLQTRAKQVEINNNQVTAVITTSNERLAADNIIIASSPSQYSALLSTNKLTESPITTVYLQYAPTTRLRSSMIGMTGTLSQWLFDRSEQHPGLLAVVISAQGKHQAMNNNQLIEHVSTEIHQLFPHIPNTAEHAMVIREKRATFLCSVSQHRHRPNTTTSVMGLWLAGDYVANHYPATLEGAIRNGEACAEHILKATSSAKSM